jgi:HK97 family phage prohead protease
MNENLFYRHFALERDAVDEEKRQATLSFSSETGYRRWFGMEYLSHADGAVDLSRLESVGAVLYNHDPEKIIGPVLSVAIKDRRGIATIGFDDDEEGNRWLAKVKSGSLRGVSIGYLPEKGRELEADEEYEGFTGPGTVFTKWAPYEITLTPIPADATVGVGRDLTRSLDGIAIHKEDKSMDEAMVRQIAAGIVEEVVGKLKVPAMDEVVEAVVRQIGEQTRLSDETAKDLMTRAGAISPEFKAEVADMIVDGQPEQVILRAINDKAAGTKDARDSKGSDSAPPAKSALDELDSATFCRMLTNPAFNLA